MHPFALGIAVGLAIGIVLTVLVMFLYGSCVVSDSADRHIGD
jgi:hypothetical protein